MVAKFYGDENGKIQIHNQAELDAILKEIESSEYKVLEVKKRRTYQKAATSFRTSTLQQEASKHLNFSTQKTMRLAQQLYEGVDIKGSGTVGLITYLRTDSTVCLRKQRQRQQSISAAIMALIMWAEVLM